MFAGMFTLAPLAGHPSGGTAAEAAEMLQGDSLSESVVERGAAELRGEVVEFLARERHSPRTPLTVIRGQIVSDDTWERFGVRNCNISDYEKHLEKMAKDGEFGTSLELAAMQAMGIPVKVVWGTERSRLAVSFEPTPPAPPISTSVVLFHNEFGSSTRSLPATNNHYDLLVSKDFLERYRLQGELSLKFPLESSRLVEEVNQLAFLFTDREPSPACRTRCESSVILFSALHRLHLLGTSCLHRVRFRYKAAFGTRVLTRLFVLP